MGYKYNIYCFNLYILNVFSWLIITLGKQNNRQAATRNEINKQEFLASITQRKR